MTGLDPKSVMANNSAYSLYGDFLNSLEDHSIMTHQLSDIAIADLFFEGYLSDEELRERQCEGRYWDIFHINDSFYKLYILLDNETALCVVRSHKGPHCEHIWNRADNRLPDSLRERYYD